MDDTDGLDSVVRSIEPLLVRDCDRDYREHLDALLRLCCRDRLAMASGVASDAREARAGR
jgi:hypothetical protein